MDYKTSGVNIEAGEDAVKRIKPLVRSTFNENVVTDIGGFGGLYRIDLNQWKNPILVSSMDGVGTKLLIAKMAGIYDTVGQDLVNHCVNDIFVQGAIPQYFLDYIGVGTLKPQQISQIISGLVQACRENSMALIGGEMAEMPGIYASDDFDLAGTIVGLVEKEHLVTGSAITPGDVILGFASNGLHTNGYSLARDIIFRKGGLKVDSVIPDLGLTVAEAFLKVHKSYLPELRGYVLTDQIHGMAHITGGGIPGNIKRVIPDNCRAFIEVGNWEIPPIFQFLQKAGGVIVEEMFKVFNMGIGYIAVVPESVASQLQIETEAIRIGTIECAKADQERVFIHYA